ncbi:glycoside hydrolase family 32 protein [Candidatus Promineifilum breve]|nr:glycoside hydrolase family 32 protein [Candidatus Promineifilum breve]
MINHRPAYHFLPPAGWMNDPNGFIHHRGIYHLFYQHNPAGAYHADIHWGHARSVDLVRWQHRPMALTPSPGGPDQGGCWSGSAVVAAGRPLIYYTGVSPQTVCRASGSDDLDEWTKDAANPLISGPPPGFGGDTGDFRDPYVWRAGEQWYMVMGSRVAGEGGAVLLYRSADLLAWEYVGPLLLGDPARREPVWTGTMWECPNLFPLAGRHVLIVSFQDWARGDLLFPGYFVGDFDGVGFRPGRPRVLEYGGCLYAPLVTIDASGRAVLMGWLMEGRDPAAQRAAGWSGVMSLPRVLSLGDDETLRIQPIPELAQLRGEPFQPAPQLLYPGAANPLRDVGGDCLELDLTLTPRGATAFRLRLLASPDGSDGITLRGDFSVGTIAFDRPDSVAADHPARLAAEIAPLPAERPLRLRVFVDRSVVEVFVNERVVLSTRVYAARPDSLGVELLADGGALAIEAIDVWPMRAIWDE